MRLKEIAGILTVITVFCGCSVKEDRGECPCYTEVEFVGELREPVTARFMNMTTTAMSKEFSGIKYDGEGRMLLKEAPVPRDMHQILAWCRAEKSTVLWDKIVAQPGEEIDSVRTGSVMIDTRHEDAHAVVELFRHYCEIRVEVVGGKDLSYPFNFKVKGKVMGIMMEDGSPVPGEFFYEPVLNRITGRFSVNVPRQIARENTLHLEVYDGKDYVATLPLGEFIANTGYNWNAPNLVPVDILIDYAKAKIVIKVNDWGLGWVIENFEI